MFRCWGSLITNFGNFILRMHVRRPRSIVLTKSIESFIARSKKQSTKPFVPCSSSSLATKMNKQEEEEEEEARNRLRTYRLRPMDKINENEKARYVKIHFVRHAEGTHNVYKEYNDPKHLDARLTERGREQCETLAKSQPCKGKKNVTILTSPMTRCLQTAQLVFNEHVTNENNSNRSSNMIALEELRETVNYQCDVRRKTSELKSEFGGFACFKNIEHNEEDPYWLYWLNRCGSEKEHQKHRESASLYKVADRARAFFAFVANRAINENSLESKEEDEEIVVSSHSAFLRCMFNFGHGQDKFDYHMGGSEQTFDDRVDKTNNVKVVEYVDDDAFEEYMRRDYENCEMRSCVLELL